MTLAGRSPCHLVWFAPAVLLLGIGAGACGGSPGTTARGDAGGDGNTTNGDDQSSTPSGCSTDSSDSLADGKYVHYLTGLSTPKTQVRIFLANCRYCSDSVKENESPALTSGGTWTSEFGAVNDGQEIRITAGVVYTLSGDGQTLSYDDATWYKTQSATYTCDGL